jgi:hypothetical protein
VAVDGSAVCGFGLIQRDGEIQMCYPPQWTGGGRRRRFRDVHAITQHIGVHSRTLETAGRILFGLEPDVPLLML